MDYKLFKISQDRLNTLNEIEENEGELTPELEIKLKITEDRLEEQVIEMNNIINFIQSGLDAAEKEMFRIIEYKKRKEKLLYNIKHNLLQALLLFGQEDKKGVKRLQFSGLELSTRKSSSIEILNANLIPDKYKKVDVSIKNLTLNQLESLKTIDCSAFETQEERDTINYILNQIEEKIKISKTELKPDLEEKTIMFNKEYDEALNNFKLGIITEEEFDRIDKELNEIKYSLVNAAQQVTNYNLVIK